MSTPIRVSPVPPGYDPKWELQLQQQVALLGARWATDRLTPVTGFTHTVPPNNGLCLLTPAGALATGTVTLPAAITDGFEQTILSTFAVTTLTVAANTGQTVQGTVVFALAANVAVRFRYLAATTTWYRMN